MGRLIKEYIIQAVPVSLFLKWLGRTEDFMLICTETNHCYLTSRNTSIFEKFQTARGICQFFLKDFAIQVIFSLASLL